MGAKRCTMHEDQPAVSACLQCRKDLCKSCVMVTPAGAFCSSECSVLHREMKSHVGAGASSSGAGMKLVLTLLALVAISFVIHLAPMTTGKSFDVIGRMLIKAQAR